MSVVIDLDVFRREREAQASGDGLTVERGESPDNPAVSYYKIRGASFAAVQTQINSLIAEVECFGNGSGQFLMPTRGDDGNYYSVGRVEVFPDAEIRL